MNKSGKVVDSWSLRYKGGHGLSLWNDGGEDFLFICDTNGIIIKTNMDGRELMLIGHPSEYGAYEKDASFVPTETTIGPNGDIYRRWLRVSICASIYRKWRIYS